MDKIKELILKNKKRIAAVLTVLVILCIAFFAGEPLSKNKSKKLHDIENTTSAKSKDVILSENITLSETTQEETSVNEQQTTENPEDGNASTEETVQNMSSSDDSDLTELNDTSDKDSVIYSTKDDTEGNITQQSSFVDKGNTQITGNDAGNNSGNSGSEVIENKNTGNTSGTGGVNNQGSSNSDGRNTGTSQSVANECTISISCRTILNNMGALKKEKKDIVPSDGYILKSTKYEYNEGDTVFDVLKKVCINQKIPMEFSYTPLYGSNYVEGIENIYEFDCGSLSGWMYSVNGKFYNYGSSEIKVNKGDVIKWEYTCDLGKDIS